MVNKKEYANILYNSLCNSKQKFDESFTIFNGCFNKLIKIDNFEMIFISLEFYSFNCIKIEYELITNNKIDLLNLLRNNPIEKKFVWSGLSEGFSTMYDLFDKKKLKAANLHFIDDLRELRDTVVCHCDPDNYEFFETMQLVNEKVGAIKQIQHYLSLLKKRKDVIDKYFTLIESLIKILNTN